MTVPSKQRRTDSPTVFLHWTLFITLVISLMTGLRISGDAKDAFWSRLLDPLLLQGSVIQWHTWAAVSLAVTSLAYIVFLLRSHLLARIRLDRTRISQLGVENRKERWKAINVILYWFAFILLLTGTVSGVLVYFFPGTTPYEITMTIHRSSAWLLIAYTFIHVIAQLSLGGIRQILKIMSPQVAYAGTGVFALAIASAVGATIVVLDKSTNRTLNIPRISEVPTLDGDLNDQVWQNAKSVEIVTTAGQNQPGSETPVTVALVHNGEYLYGRFEWPDSTRSQKHLPLQKTANGWRVVQSEFSRKDEDKYYEDKFGVLLSKSPEIGGGGSIQLGPKPLADKPAPSGGRGLHYTTDNSLVDVWHWKSVRTGSSDMNQIDDNFFGPPLEPSAKGGRYTGGYSKDPKEGGGFTMNWESYSDGTVVPKRLPKDASMLEQLGSLNLDPSASDDGQFWMTIDNTIPYSPEADNYPVGTVIPSVLLDGEFIGDRGDVSAFTKWRDGRWYMEVKRKLDTGSKYDIPLIPEKNPVYLWVAVFDHSQTRHSRHLHPLKLTLE